MAVYLGNKMVSFKSGYIGTSFKEFLTLGGKFRNTGYIDLTKVLHFSDTENVTTMTEMFKACKNLTALPSLDTSKVIDMSNMFEGCDNLLEVPMLNTSNVTLMVSMFWVCSKITTIPQFDTTNVTNMNSMFKQCSNLVTVPLLNTTNVTNMVDMFRGCTNLKVIPAFDTSNVTKFAALYSGKGIFDGCTSLEEIHMIGMKESFNISASTKFTRDALVEILNNLGTVTSTKTLTMGTDNLNKLTEEDKLIATNKGWTLK